MKVEQVPAAVLEYGIDAARAHGAWLGHENGAPPGELLVARAAIVSGERDCRGTCRPARLRGGAVVPGASRSGFMSAPGFSSC
jgi:hypothetical protein